MPALVFCNIMIHIQLEELEPFVEPPYCPEDDLEWKLMYTEIAEADFREPRLSNDPKSSALS